jgi:hypothetical protein
MQQHALAEISKQYNTLADASARVPAHPLLGFRSP